MRFGGPDTYVAVQIVPNGTAPLKSLNERAAKRRGITILRMGEGYSKNSGPRSSLGQAMAKGQTFVNDYNARMTTISEVL